MRKFLLLLTLSLLMLPTAMSHAADPRQQFQAAWQAAGKGRQDEVRRIRRDLGSYRLVPYLDYELLRQNRASTSEADMAAFLEAHADWGFASGLRTAWLNDLARRQQWGAFLRQWRDSSNTQLRCHWVTARVRQGGSPDDAALVRDIQDLWRVGHSQDDACDPAFAWLQSHGGITHELAWQRVELAMAEGNVRLSQYLERFLDPEQKRQRQRFARLMANPAFEAGRAGGWPDREDSWSMLRIALTGLARRDPESTWELVRQLDPQLGWNDRFRGPILHDVAVFGALGLEKDALRWAQAVPEGYRDNQLLEWQARAAMAVGDWQAVRDSIDEMPTELRDDTRWRYWLARSLGALGEQEAASAVWQALAGQATYYGFLAADRLGQPYTICELDPGISSEELDRVRKLPQVQRSIELEAVNLPWFSRREWNLALSGMDRQGLRTAAGVAVGLDWPDRAIFALGDSGDTQYYRWRFPLAYEDEVQKAAARNQLDPAWVYGIMRAESAMNPRAISGANARGLMQITPATARQLSQKHGFSYRDSSQLLDGPYNIRMGTRYLADLLAEYKGNAYLVEVAYNAGPHVARRWMKERPGDTGRHWPADVWIELVPYYETRDYIPRVMAFSTLYNWRLDQPLQRISSRLPDPWQAPPAASFTEAVCPADS